MLSGSTSVFYLSAYSTVLLYSWTALRVSVRCRWSLAVMGWTVTSGWERRRAARLYYCSSTVVRVTGIQGQLSPFMHRLYVFRCADAWTLSVARRVHDSSIRTVGCRTNPLEARDTASTGPAVMIWCSSPSVLESQQDFISVKMKKRHFEMDFVIFETGVIFYYCSLKVNLVCQSNTFKCLFRATTRKI